MTTISVPGKLILFGEYAVLQGSDALVIAVDRYVRCEVTPQPQMTVRSLGVNGHTVPTEIHSPFLIAVTQSLGAAPADFLVDSSGFQWTDAGGNARKLGLGSSAAATAAFTAALRYQLGMADPFNSADVYRIAQNAHHQVQGMGSGADVAASCFGGALHYRWIAERKEMPSQERGQWVRCTAGSGFCLSLTGGLTEVVVAWAGQSADTRNLVEAVHRARDADRSRYEDIMAVIEESSRLGQTAWCKGDRRALRKAAERGRNALEELGSLAKVVLVTDGHRRLSESLDGLNVCVKPTGAGGGDLAWIVTEDEGTDHRAITRLGEAGIPAWRLSVVNHGAHVSSPADRV